MVDMYRLAWANHQRDLNQEPYGINVMPLHIESVLREQNLSTSISQTKSWDNFGSLYKLSLVTQKSFRYLRRASSIP